MTREDLIAKVAEELHEALSPDLVERALLSAASQKAYKGYKVIRGAATHGAVRKHATGMTEVLTAHIGHEPAGLKNAVTQGMRAGATLAPAGIVSTGNMNAMRKSKLLRQMSSSFNDLAPHEKHVANAIMHAHERAEIGAIKNKLGSLAPSESAVKGLMQSNAQGGATHAAPSVLDRERRLVAKLSEKYPDIKKPFRQLRQDTGELTNMKMVDRGSDWAKASERYRKMLKK